MTVEFDREYPLQGGGTARYYKVGDWGFEYLLNEDGSVDPDSDANLEYAERAIAAWTEWWNWLKENLPKPPLPKPGEVWLLSQLGDYPTAYKNVPAVVTKEGYFVFQSKYDLGTDRVEATRNTLENWDCKRIWPPEGEN